MSVTNPDCPFPETADIHTSSEEYAARFAGAWGAWMLGVQERYMLEFVGRVGPTNALDVGGGHGQSAGVLCRKGIAVTVLGSDESCGRRVRPLVEGGGCRFMTGNVLALPFEDRSFDVVLCFRLATHCGRWEELLGELCRVARRGVVMDYPTGQSLNAVAPALFGAKKRLEGNTRTFRLFRHEEVDAVFSAHGFRRTGTRKQFFLPMVLHRMLRCAAISAGLERICRGVGLTRGWGSPVVGLWERGEE